MDCGGLNGHQMDNGGDNSKYMLITMAGRGVVMAMVASTER